MTLEPWIIEQREEEERRRREEDEARRSRIELPLTSPATDHTDPAPPDGERPARHDERRVQIVPISPDSDSTFDL